MSELHIFVFRSALLAFAFSFILTATSSAQQKQWTRYETDDGSFSLELPPTILVNAKNDTLGTVFRIHGFLPNFDIEISARHSKDAFEVPPRPVMLDRMRESVSVGDLRSQRYTGNLGGRDAASYVVKTKRLQLTVEVVYDVVAEPTLKRFVEGFRLAGKVVYGSGVPLRDDQKAVKFSSLKSSPEIEAARKGPAREFAGKIAFKAADSPLPRNEQVTRRAIVVEKPVPSYRDFQIILPNSGVPFDSLRAVVHVVLAGDGSVGDIAFIGDTDQKYAKAVVGAVKRIRFIPAQADGRSIESVVILRYETGVMPFLLPRTPRQSLRQP
jgi:hypothetical protein